MKITKYEHSCMVLDNGENRLVIDPGVYSQFGENKNIAAVIVTHIHNDHFDMTKLTEIAKENPGAQFFGPPSVARQATRVNMTPVVLGDVQDPGGFRLKFFGDRHELFRDIENIGVLVNETFFYPGDSFSRPDIPIKVLALPAAAPWLRVPDAANYLEICKPKQAFPVHNALLSEIGESIHYRIINEAVQITGTDWHVLRPGESIEVSTD